MTPDTPADGEALAEAIAELPMVKPLEWVETQSEIPHHAWETWTGFGRWVIVLRFQSMNAATYWLFSLGYPTLEAAKSAAQADYTARIRAALIPRPAEAAQVAQNARIRRRFENWQDALNDSDCSVRDCLMQRALFHAEIEDAYKAGKVIVPIAAAQEGRE